MLGYSFMGKAHSNAYARMPVFFYPPPARPRLVAIAGRTEGKVKEAAVRFGFQRYYTDWNKLVADPEVEVVDNGLPNDMHLGPCVEAAERGKHILCEKPLGRNPGESQAMLRAAEKAGVKHMVAFNYRFVPAVRLAKQFIDEGYIGKVLQFRAAYLQDWAMDPDVPRTWRFRKESAGSGALGDLGAHIIDLSRFLVGEIGATVGIAKTFTGARPLPGDPTKKGEVDVDDAFVALVKFTGGAVGSLEASRFCAGRRNFQRIEIHGTEGSIGFNLERLNELEVYSNREQSDRRGFKTILVTEADHPFVGKWWPRGHIIGWEHAMVHEVYHFFDVIARDGRVAPWGATFYDGLRADEVIEAVQKSISSQRWEAPGLAS
ncbi:MAG: Gfo/Idh/MocA family oxidoreductase [Nitrososphaerota archaeon]|jgi:predicted dehydrogenase|nr:Gfo/Idh/MocA family oxidoreductase [Nitrososphaerota archaeon]MDG6947253.1 Gfo/Idh/MocA family oxidoreductase [Nitrososphaerota archaeon]MDG6955314.1 Gfo/Idh/MocA family oxidoreductase [Nitrososphaerota archaeon]